MMMIRPTALLASLFLLVAPLGTLAYPSGAGNCESGEAPVRGSHLSNALTSTGSLTDGGFIVTLDGGDALVSGSASSILITEPSTLTLTSTDGTQTFKGFLMRLGRGPNDIDTTSALTSDDAAVQVAQAPCIDALNVGGVTHNANNDKTSVSATIQLDEPAPELLLEVTVVVSNNGMDGSFYYYDSYVVNADIPTTGVLTPVAAPTIPEGTNPQDLTTPPVALDPAATPVPTTRTFIAPNRPTPQETANEEPAEAPVMAPTTSSNAMQFLSLLQIAFLVTLMVAGLVVTVW